MKGASHSKAAGEELRAFETGAVDPAQFPHSEHVRLGYEMLGRYSFGEAISRFSSGLKLLAAKAGKPQVYHETITVAFLALINERRTAGPNQTWGEFRANNADLFDKRCLEKWYGAEQLRTDLARRTFCLPTLPRERPEPQPV
ncbi:MAG: hypothetical protein ABR611_09590 [Chthoniobacterales bacterium]